MMRKDEFHAARAAQAERAAIVTWLRRECELREGLNRDAGPGVPIATLNYNAARASALTMAVDAIERGDHLNRDREGETK